LRLTFLGLAFLGLAFLGLAFLGLACFAVQTGKKRRAVGGVCLQG
jgi:hypothetical protein